MPPTPDNTDERHARPPPALLAAIHGALFIAALVALNAVADGSMPTPGSPSEEFQRFVGANAGLLRVVGMLQFGAAVPLALFAATMSSRLRHLGVRAAGTSITLAGGLVAAGLLAITGLLTVTAGATVDRATPAVSAVVQELTFFVGGAGYIVFFGLMLAGIAITGLLTGFLPRPLAVATLVVFAVAELSTLSLAVEPLTATIPVARFAGLVAVVAVGAKLPTQRAAPLP